MELLTPGIGLIFWQGIIFLLLLFVLTKYAWKPITDSLKEREKFMPERGTLSIKKAKDLLGYEPKNPIERGYIKYIQWYKNFWNNL